MPSREAVGDDCRLRLADGGRLDNVFGIGLGTGYRLSGSMGGEPNFVGQANSLWLYQNDIGAVIHRGDPDAVARPGLRHRRLGPARSLLDHRASARAATYAAILF